VTASHRRTVTVVVAALGVAFLLVWAANAGPERVVGERQAPSVVDSGERPTSPEPGTEGGDERADDPARPGRLGAWVQDLAAFAVIVAGLVVGWLVVRQLFLQIRRRLADERLVVPLDPLPDLGVARAAVERNLHRQREALAGSDVRNGIVACWVLFEEAASEAHVARLPAETATEFVVRFLHILDVDPRPVAELARLFHEARFSSHAMAADARTHAEHALSGVHRDLAGTGAAP
jgi:Domain of unknown function (DUF4129)